MVHVVDAAFDDVARVGVEAPFGTSGEVLDAAFKSEFKLLLSGEEGEGVFGIRCAHVEEHAVIQDAVPTQGAHGVAPRDGGVETGLCAVKAEYVFAEVSR